MKFNNIQELQQQFTGGNLIPLPKTIVISGVTYNLTLNPLISIDEAFNSETKPMAIYSIDEYRSPMADEQGLEDHIALVWNNSKVTVHPSVAQFVPRNKLYTSIQEADVPDDRIIRTHVSIILSGFNGNQPIKAKVDTGAGVCSLNANNVQVDRKNGMVAFDFGDKHITMPVVDTEAVLTAENGVENRPVVEFDVVVPNTDSQKKNKVISKVQFNLNDRSGMPDKLLLGQNFIKAGNFVVMGDSEQKKTIETIDWASLQSMFKTLPKITITEKSDAEIWEIIKNAIQNIQ